MKIDAEKLPGAAKRGKGPFLPCSLFKMGTALLLKVGQLIRRVNVETAASSRATCVGFFGALAGCTGDFLINSVAPGSYAGLKSYGTCRQGLYKNLQGATGFVAVNGLLPAGCSGVS